MPVEIRELVIRAVVEAPRAAPAPELAPSVRALPAAPPPAPAAPMSPPEAAVVDACVREVLRRLRRARER